MAAQHIIETVQNIFTGADERDWDRCLASMDEKVYLDYSSMGAGDAKELPATDIISSWKTFLPRFKATHHQLGNFTIREHNGEAEVAFYGTATHFFPTESMQNVWTVVGTYNAKLVSDKGQWKVTALRFNLKYQDGNLALPQIAGN
ncbi:nuclear transport factor 2 family protein [Chitinophaga barathri]|uniref:Nuclear transport factor 2 family protein n=1 Tax=Chitinophaga barathri TaxID=1647451 RepID=A0A3N4MF08_9BACT|nr:nuclear transport factor 2 family protein [Chitinophaga barathri]RPD40576.1 nuclear transport factor 2 family protein [Chitinophaga barathri]